MPKVLHIQASPRGDSSASVTVAKEFLEAYQTRHPGATVETFDLWKADLPPFDAEAAEAKDAVLQGRNPTGAQVEAWAGVVKIADHFKSADLFVFSVPMWNFSIPYRLKHYIDLIGQPGLTVGFSPEKGYWGLVTGRPAIMIYARGGAYGPGTGLEAYDLQSRYLKQVLGFMGITDQRDIFVEGTGMNSQGIEAARKQAAELGSSF